LLLGSKIIGALVPAKVVTTNLSLPSVVHITSAPIVPPTANSISASPVSLASKWRIASESPMPLDVILTVQSTLSPVLKLCTSSPVKLPVPKRPFPAPKLVRPSVIAPNSSQAKILLVPAPLTRRPAMLSAR
jgi:hypothetical protein